MIVFIILKAKKVKFVINVKNRGITVALEKIVKEALPAVCMMAMGTADVVGTYYNVQTYGMEIEANPMLRFLFDYIPLIPAMAIPKLATVGVIEAVSRRSKKWGDRLMYTAGGVWGAAAGLNAYILLQ